MHPELSVLMANYNHGQLVSRAIEAVVSQSRLPDEYIIIDDGSTDNSVEVIESYAERYPFIRLIRNEENMGALSAVTRAMGMATGGYIYFGAADDYVLPGFFEQAMAMAGEYPHAGIIFGDMVIVTPEGSETDVLSVPQWQESLYASPEVFLNEYLDVELPTASLSPATIHKKSAWEDTGGLRTELGHWCDTFIARAIALKYGACYLPHRCTAWTVSPDGFSQGSARNPKLMLDVVARAAWLMRSPEFRDRFPEEYVRKWESGYRGEIVKGHLSRFRSSYAEMSGRLTSAIFPGTWVDRIASSLLVRGLGLGERLLGRHLERALRRHSGDVSCYMH